MKYQIFDWAGNLKFNGKTFSSFEAANDFLIAFIERTYPDTVANDDRLAEEIGEFYIEKSGPKGLIT